MSMKKTILIFLTALIMQSIDTHGGAYSSHGDAALPFLAFMTHAFFRSAPVDIEAVWNESVKRAQTSDNNTLYPGYFAVISCPHKTGSSGNGKPQEEKTGSNSQPSPFSSGNDEAAGAVSHSAGASGQDPDDNDKRKHPAWVYEEDDDFDENVLCNVCKVNIATHTTAGCCKKKICESCIKAVSNDHCALCGTGRSPVYRCHICHKVEKKDQEVMQAHMYEHARNECGGRRFVYRGNEGEQPRVLFATLSEIIQWVSARMFVSCPFPGCRTLHTMLAFQSHMQEHSGQPCPAKGCNRTCSYQHILGHLPDFSFFFESCSFVGSYSGLIEAVESNAKLFYCQVCIPRGSLPKGYSAICATIYQSGACFFTVEGCLAHCMYAHASLHCSRCPAQFSCLNIQEAQAHANGHPVYLPIPINEEESDSMPELVSLQLSDVESETEGYACPYCNVFIEGNDDDLAGHMETCFQPD